MIPIASSPQSPPDRALSAPTVDTHISRTHRDKRRRSARAATALRSEHPQSAPFCRTAAIFTAPRKPDLLGAYTGRTGRRREVIAIHRGDGCMLVVDRDALTLGDRRLVACLQADEPPENASVVCAHYLSDESRGRCRRVSLQDLAGESSAEESLIEAALTEDPLTAELAGRGLDADTCSRYRLRLCKERRCRRDAELCWCRERPGQAQPEPVCLREVVGALESYEPACELTRAALAVYDEEVHVSSTTLRAQLQRVRESPIVLNRKLRQAVLAAGERRDLSMSEIALRCGRIKRDGKGNCSGETSWLARRVGLLPESGSGRPTPWVHSDVLALIARNGLGVSPREVELG
jgi:hypothetical protein